MRSAIIIVRIATPYMNASIASNHHCQIESSIAATKKAPSHDGCIMFRQKRRRATGDDFGLAPMPAPLPAVRVLDRNDSHHFGFEQKPNSFIQPLLVSHKCNACSNGCAIAAAHIYKHLSNCVATRAAIIRLLMSNESCTIKRAVQRVAVFNTSSSMGKLKFYE